MSRMQSKRRQTTAKMKTRPRGGRRRSDRGATETMAIATGEGDIAREVDRWTEIDDRDTETARDRVTGEEMVTESARGAGTVQGVASTKDGKVVQSRGESGKRTMNDCGRAHDRGTAAADTTRGAGHRTRLRGEQIKNVHTEHNNT
jgi:hypothetical protein